MNTTTAKRVARTLRASPVKEQRPPIAKEDIENLSAVTLAALGMAPSSSSSSKDRAINNTGNGAVDSSMAAVTPQPSDRTVNRLSKMSNEMYATPPSTVKSRTVSSSSRVSVGSSNNNNPSSIGRTRDRTATASSTAASEVSSHNPSHSQAPLTAIRRPPPQVHHQNTHTPASRSASGGIKHSNGSIKASPSSLKLSTNGNSSAVRSRKSSNPPISSSSSLARDNTPSSIRSRASSSEASRLALREQATLREEDEEVKANEKGVYVTQEEYSSLVALLSAKDEQIASLKEQVDEGRKELSGLKERNTKLSKDRDTLILEKKELIKNVVSSSSGKEGSDSPSNGDDGPTISRRDFQTFKKQYEMQENLLEGFQRENEKATTELEALKKREKHLTEQLKKIYGPTFSADTDMNPLTPEHGGFSKRYPTSLLLNNNGYGPNSPSSNGKLPHEQQHRRRSGFGLVPSSLMNNNTSPLSLDSVLNEENGFSIEEGSEEKGNEERKTMMDVEPAVLMDQLMSVQSLLERFEKRLLVRESELIKKEREANEQMEKLQRIAAV